MPLSATDLAHLPPLDRRAAFTQRGACKICDAPAVAFDRVDFNKYCSETKFDEFGASGVMVEYLRCLRCSFVFTADFDDWTPDAFARFIYNDDYIKVDGEYADIRPNHVARDFARRLRGCERARILDYGSGAGVFVRRMRDHGFRDIEAFDPFSSPERPSGRFDIITCFEVIEHTPDPVGMLGDMLNYLRDDGCIIFSQTVQPPTILSLRGNWWYVAPRNGHVSTYSEESLVALGRRHDLLLHKGSTVYAFAPRQPSSFAAAALRQIGPSFTTLRLLAPGAVQGKPLAFPSPQDVYWLPADADEVWRYRWTGAACTAWDARWGKVSRLQVRLPFVREVEPGFAAACALELGGQLQPVMLDRGELVAEFDAGHAEAGPILLHTPDPLPPNNGSHGLPRGLAVPLSELPDLLVPNTGQDMGKAA